MAAALEAAFTELYAAHAERLHTYCLRLTGSPDDAADALQDTFTAVLTRLESDAAPIEHPKAYLYATARHACLRRISERGRTEVVAEVPEAEPAAGPAGGEQAVLTDELRQEVRAAHDKLPARQREVLFLREVEELSYADIGAVMELTPNGAAQLAWRARAGLRTDLRHRALLAVAVYDRDCDRARTLLGLREDDTIDPADDAWLDQHLADCERCRASRGLLLEAGLTYRAVLPIAALPFTAEKAWASAREAQAGASGGGGQGGGGAHRGAMAGAAAGAVLFGMLLLATSAQTPLPAPPPAAVQIASVAPPVPERTQDAAQDDDDARTGEDDDEAEPPSRAGAGAGGSTDSGSDDEPADDDGDAGDTGGGDDIAESTTPPTSPADDTARVPRPAPPSLTPATGRDPAAPAPVSTVAPSQTPPAPLAGPQPQPAGPAPASPGPGIPDPAGEPTPVDPPPCDSSHGNNGSSGPGGACEPCLPGQERRPDDDEGPPLLGTALRITLCVEVGAERDLGDGATPPRAPRRGAGAASRGR